MPARLPISTAASRWRWNRHRGGFTLVEVMMAAVILVVGIIGLMQAVTIGSEMLDASRKQRIAEQIIENEIAWTHTLPWRDFEGNSNAVSSTANPINICYLTTIGTSSIKVNNTGTGVTNTDGSAATTTTIGYFALTNSSKVTVSSLVVAPSVNPNNVFNITLLDAARGFTIKRIAASVLPTSSSVVPTYVQIDYTVSWTSLSGRYTVVRTAEVFFGRNGLHLAYQKS